MCGRYRLTKCRMLEIEDYYGIDDIRELDLWQREFNIPPTEVASIIFDHKEKRHFVQVLWGLIAPGTESLEEARKISTPTSSPWCWRSRRVASCVAFPPSTTHDPGAVPASHGIGLVGVHMAWMSVVFLM